MCFLIINGDVGYGSPTELSLGGQSAKFKPQIENLNSGKITGR